MKIMSIILSIALVTANACAGNSGRTISAVYVSPDTGGYLIFKESGQFYYAFEPTANEQYGAGKLPSNEGTYRIEANGKVAVRTRSAHYGLFKCVLSQAEAELTVTRFTNANRTQVVTTIFKRLQQE